MSETLPPVAKSFFTFCKKCDADRYHTVLAHKTSSSASVKCEVCGAKSTYSLPKAQTRKATSSTSSGAARPLTGAAAKARANSENAKRSAHAAQYESLMAQYSDKEAASYSMKARFEANQKLNHPKFGIGFITMANAEKLDVVFQDEVRSLVHNRG